MPILAKSFSPTYFSKLRCGRFRAVRISGAVRVSGVVRISGAACGPCGRSEGISPTGRASGRDAAAACGGSAAHGCAASGFSSSAAVAIRHSDTLLAEVSAAERAGCPAVSGHPAGGTDRFSVRPAACAACAACAAPVSAGCAGCGLNAFSRSRSAMAPTRLSSRSMRTRIRIPNNATSPARSRTMRKSAAVISVVYGRLCGSFCARVRRDAVAGAVYGRPCRSMPRRLGLPRRRPESAALPGDSRRSHAAYLYAWLFRPVGGWMQVSEFFRNAVRKVGKFRSRHLSGPSLLVCLGLFFPSASASAPGRAPSHAAAGARTKKAPGNVRAPVFRGSRTVISRRVLRT